MGNLMSEIRRNNVSSIQIQNFRGISQEKKIKFTKNKRFVILRGENGTGKSSFVNAFEFLFKNDLSAIDFQMKGKKEAFIHKGSNAEDLKIKLNFSNQSYFERTIDDFVQSDKGVSRLYRNYESFLKNASFILNRKKLLNFINVKDGGRYDAISDLCGLEELEKYKNEIKDVKNDFNRAYKDKERDVSTLINGLNDILKTDSSSFGEFIPVINNELEKLGFKSIDENTDFEDYLSTLDFSKSYKIKDNINKFNEIYEEISFNQLNDDFKGILKKYEVLSNNSLIALQYSYNVLDAAKEYLKISNPDNCPICDNKIDSEKTLSDIDLRLSDVGEDISDLNEWKKEIDRLISDLNKLKQQFREINKIADELSITCSFDYSALDDLSTQLNEFAEFKSSLVGLKDNFYLKGYEEHLYEIKSSVDKQNVDLSKDEDYQKIKDLRSAINQLIQLKNMQKELDSIILKRDLSLNIFDSFNETKKDYVDEIIKNIEGDVKRYYKMLHSDDLICSPKLNAKKDNAISLFLDSFGEESDPRKYSSEGHLDSLGLCIFLAFMKEYNPLDLIVLDDIITTVDFSHKYDIANLLVKEFSEFKILITTHNGLWAQQLEKIIKNNGYNYDDLNIIHWDLVSGPVIKKNMDHVKLIDKYINAGEYSAAVNTARQYLEYTTFEFCKRNTVKIKLDDKYTLYPLYEATKPVSIKKAKKLDDENLKKVGDGEEIKLLCDRLDYLWSELDANYFIVNNLSHYNEESFFIYSGEAKYLCELVKELCPILDRFRDKNK